MNKMPVIFYMANKTDIKPKKYNKNKIDAHRFKFKYIIICSVHVI